MTPAARNATMPTPGIRPGYVQTDITTAPLARSERGFSLPVGRPLVRTALFCAALTELWIVRAASIYFFSDRHEGERVTAMPACIVLVHDDPGFANPALAALRAAGYDAVGFQDLMSAIDALEHPKRIELLITRVRFPPGTPNGVALACMARLKRPGIKVLFTSFPEVRQHTDGIGEFLPRPLSSDELLETVARMLDAHPIRLPRRLSPVQAQNAEMLRHRPSIGSREAASLSIGSNDSVSVA